jgi:hypothetical protein
MKTPGRRMTSNILAFFLTPESRDGIGSSVDWGSGRPVFGIWVL